MSGVADLRNVAKAMAAGEAQEKQEDRERYVKNRCSEGKRAD